MQFVDSHTHLADTAFDSDRDAVIERARDAGAVALICIGESLPAASRARTIATQWPGFIWYTAGVHPHDAAAFSPQGDIGAIREHIALGAVAVGECGLDYYYDHAPRLQQRRAFAEQIALAGQLRVPLIVHSRDAVDDTAAMVAEAGRAGIRGVMHCFSGPPSLAECAIEAGWYVSFSGIVTFRKWADDALIRSIPDDRILIETDAPYLAPVPFRGKRNEPAHTVHTALRVAAARDIPADALGRMLCANAARLFGLALADAAS